jgi:membrane protein
MNRPNRLFNTGLARKAASRHRWTKYGVVLRRCIKEASDDGITNVAAALAYYTFLAIPACLLVAAGVFSLAADRAGATETVDRLGQVLPPEAVRLLRDELAHLTERRWTGITLIGVGGFVALSSLGAAMRSVIWALHVAHDRSEIRGLVRRSIAAYTLAVFAALAFALLLVLLALGPQTSQWVADAAGRPSLTTWVWWTAQWPIVIGGLVASYSSVTYFGLSGEPHEWHLWSPGALLATAVWIVASAGFAAYVSAFGSYNKTWGTLSAIVVLMTWLWLGGLALLFGAELDAEVQNLRVLPTQPSA